MHLRQPALLLLAVTLVACGDDEPRANPGAAVGQTCFVNGDCADGLSCVSRVCQDPDAPDDDPSDDPANNDGDPVNNDINMPECDTGSLDITTPATGAALTNNDDDDPNEPGVQIAVRVAASLPEGSILAVENLTTRQSAGARLQGNEAIVAGLTLVTGTNRLQALASGQGCAVRSQEVVITLQAPETCQLDEDCPQGALCGQGGVCEACQAACQGDDDCGDGRCVQGCFCQGDGPSFVLIEDLTPRVSGQSPGTDLDAVGLVRGQDEHFATRIEDARVDHPDNVFNDPDQALGAPDAQCQVQNFVSLGGQSFGGYVIVSFGDGPRRTTLERGDQIRVYEVGALLCGRFDDDPYSVSVSTSNDLGTFVEQGTGGAGGNLIPVSF